MLMKTPIVEKSTLKGIIIWFSICCLLSLTVFVSKAVNFEAYRINSPEKELTQGKWNSLVTTWIEKFLNKYNDEDLYKYKFPIGTVVMYAKSWGCPKWWEQWWDGLDWKFIMPLQTTDWTALMYGGSKSFTILNENLPKHSHKFIYDGQGSAWVSESTYLALNNYGNQNYWDYDLKFNSNVATVGLTSREWWDEPIEFMPKYAKVLFCIKVSDVGWEQEEEEEGNNGWEQQEVVQQYTVKFNANWWLWTMSEQKFNAGDSITLTPNGFMKEWYTFNGWNTESDGSWTPYTDQQEITINSDLKLYAVWEYSPQTYTIEFSKGLDSDVMWTMSDLECKVWVPCKLTKNQYRKNNYDFVWWSVWTTPTETPDYLDEASVLDIASGWETKTLYPIWKSNTPSTPSCTPRTCGYYNRASKAPSSWCYSTVDKEDGCWWNLTCYSIWCDEITRDRWYTWYKWYKCYNAITALSPRQQTTMVVCSWKDWWYCADPSLEWWYYWISAWWSYYAPCGSSPTCPSYLDYGWWPYSCASSQQNSYCKTPQNQCWKCAYRTTQQIFNNTPPSP